MAPGIFSASGDPVCADGAIGAQLALTRSNLERANDVLTGRLTAELLPPALRDQLGQRLHERGLELGEIERAVTNGAPRERIWVRLAAVQAAAERPLAELLAFIQGALLRRAHLDKGVCAAADALLAELQGMTAIRWSGLAILGDDEAFLQRPQVILLRFPEFTAWALPLAAHEFGHLVAQEQREQSDDGTSTFPVLRALSNAGEDAQRFGELFADVFATYALGPAYACTAILLRFTPPGNSDSGTHPSDATRVYVILRTLRWLSGMVGPDRPFDHVADQLAQTWSEDGAAAGDEATLAYWVDEIFLDDLAKRLPRARCAGWGAAASLSRVLPGDAPLPKGARPRDVLNGAWLARLRTFDDTDAADHLSTRALQACRAFPPHLQ